MQKTQVFLAVAVIATLVGLVDAFYLTVTHYAGNSVVCSLIDGCNLVLASTWAEFFTIPTALIGVIYYSVVLTLLGYYWYRPSDLIKLLTLAVLTVGFALSFVFLYLQFFVIQAVCEYCLLSFLATTVTWVSIMLLTYRVGDTIDA